MGKIQRREFIKLSGAAGASLVNSSLALAASVQGSTHASRPNIVIFLTDDHGQWAQHAYGNSELKTPNMDRLAAQGTRMTQAFTTCPVCSPARASFFTGRMPSQHGIHDWLKEDTDALTHPGLAGQTLISELMKDAGYHTALIGKWHCGKTSEPKPGFDRWFSYWTSQYPHEGVQHFSDQGKEVVDEGQQSPLLTRQAINFLQDHQQKTASKAEPFFLFISYVDTHSPHNAAPDNLVAEYDTATFRDIPKEKLAACHGKALEPVAADPEKERRRRMEYYGAVSSIDAEVGKVLDALKAAGQMENTLVIYTGDHGLNAGQHGLWEKGNATIPQNFLEESIRISCTVSWPGGGFNQNAICDDLVSHPDLWATLLDVAEATPDTATAAKINSPGQSYLRQLRGKKVSGWRQTMISEYGNARMARNGRYKLIRRYPFAAVTFPDELYDLREDPRETVNRYSDPALKSVIEELSGEIDQFFAKYTVPGHSGLDMEHQPECTPASPWLVAARTNKA
ncbi:MAG: sulfatase-like hydrolase/transferase [Granulicella sp.]